MPPLLAPALVSLGVSASVAGPLSSILFTGLSIALSILFAPKVPDPEKGRVPFKQTIPPRIRIIGERRTAGAIMLFHAVKGRAHVVQALCEGPAQALTSLYLHDDIVNIHDGNYLEAGGDDGSYGEHKVYFDFRLGLPTETAFAEAVSDIGDTTIWSTNHRGDGIVSSHFKASDAGQDEQAKRFPFGLPSFSAVVNATKVFDPREMASSPAQDWADPDTWSFAGNDNPILQTMWFLTATVEEGGMGLDFEECFSTVLTEVGEQADVCDEPVPNKAGGGVLPRYISGALYHFSDDPSEVLAAILGTCDGFCAERGDGAFELKAGKWDDEDFAITIEDRHIISLNVKRFKPDEDEVTGVIVKYTSVDHQYAEIDAPVWPRDAYMGGEDHRVRTISVTYCTAGRQAQRLSKRVATYEMAPVTGTAVLTMYGILLLDRRGATINCTDDPALQPSATSPLETIKIRLTRVEPNLLNGTVEIDFQVFDPTVTDAWDAATEEGDLQPDVFQPLGTALSVPTALTPVPYEVSGSINVDVGFNPGVDSGDNIGYRAEWRIKNIGGGNPGPSTRVEFRAGANDIDGTPQIEYLADDFWLVTLTNMPEGELEVRLMAYRNNFSGWSTWTDMDTNILAPARPRNLVVTAGVGEILVEWDAPNSPNMDHARVYRATSGAGFGLASDISGEIAGGPNDPMSFIDVEPPVGTYDYWVVAETVTDVSSVPRGPETAVAPFNPLHLGAKLKAWWDADDHGTARMTDDGAGLISMWEDRVGAMQVTATLTARPTWTANALSSEPGLTFDGTADCLVSTVLTTIPTGSTAGEIWALLSQDFAAGTAGVKAVVRYGDNSQDRALTRGVVSATNRLLITGTQNLFDTVIDFSGIHVVSGAWSGTTETGRIDGRATNPASAVITSLNTATTRFRIGSNVAVAASNFWSGAMRHVLVTTTLTSGEREQLEAFLAWECGEESLLPSGHPYENDPP